MLCRRSREWSSASEFYPEGTRAQDVIYPDYPGYFLEILRSFFRPPRLEGAAQGAQPEPGSPHDVRRHGPEKSAG